MVDSATKRWIQTAADERAAADGCWFDEAAGEYVVEFFRRFLRHWEGRWAGEPFELMPWQYERLIMPLFGWKRHNEFGKPVRRFNRAYVEVPKKNGKSPTGAAIGLYMLVADGEPGAKVFSAAVDKDQAKIVHTHAIKMVEASTPLQSILTINRSTSNIHFAGTNSYYRALSGDKTKGAKEGLNGNCCIIDELHAWKGRSFWDELKYMGASREQPLMFAITTAGDDMLSVCRQQHEYAQKVIRGDTVDHSFFGLIFQADADDPWDHPDTWAKANPSLGYTVTRGEFQQSVNEAKESPSQISSFKRYRLNIWATGENPWLKLDDWLQKCQKSYTDDDLAGEPCYGGLDLSRTRDMTAFVLAFPDDETEEVKLLPYFWLPEARAKEMPNKEELFRWAEQGHIELTPGNIVDYGFVKRRILELCDKFDLLELAFDPKYAEELTQSIEQETGVDRVEFPQSRLHFTGPSKEFERRVIAGLMQHNGNPILTWQIGHAQVKADPDGNIKPVKREPNDYRTVDGVIAAIMASARATMNMGGKSFYDDNEVELV